jgi:hypothetical protein
VVRLSAVVGIAPAPRGAPRRRLSGLRE